MAYYVHAANYVHAGDYVHAVQYVHTGEMQTGLPPHPRAIPNPAQRDKIACLRPCSSFCVISMLGYYNHALNMKAVQLIVLTFLLIRPLPMIGQSNQFDEDGIRFVTGYYSDQPINAFEIHNDFLYADDNRFLLAMKMHSATDLEEVYFQPYTDDRFPHFFSLTYYNDFLYATGWEYGKSHLTLYDISNPAVFSQSSRLDGNFYKSTLSVHDGYLFAVGQECIHRLIPRPDAPPLVEDSVYAYFAGAIETGPRAAFHDSLIYFVDGLQIKKANYLKLSNAQSVASNNSPTNCLIVSGNILFAGNTSSSIDMYKLDDSMVPTKIGEIQHPLFFGSITALYEHGNHLIVLNISTGIFVYNIEDPENPVYECSVTGGADYWKDLKIQGRYIYALGSGDVNTVLIFETDIFTSAPSLPTPATFSLTPAYPNPFSGSTTITYSLPTQQCFSLDVYNTLGRKVQTLYSGLSEPGTHAARLDASTLPAGMYRVVLRSGEGVRTQMVVVR